MNSGKKARLFAPDGRVVLVIDPAEPLVVLPCGTVEPTDASPGAALVREAAEEAQLPLAPGKVERLGWVYDATSDVGGGIGECAQLRLAAPITAADPSAIDPAGDRRFARLLVPAEQGLQQADQAPTWPAIRGASPSQCRPDHGTPD
ncbi:NUDIX domain-containing protein [Streptomyces atratus]|uniref:NUDIX domain-containing protein n=1 Tax=Streptomyces atratus TaxID=1893 RepID=UPI0037ADF8FB